ncbi:acetyltransferase [Prochlorococcus marinus]|nr:acetyltransferase [Prochlorococcus marinus]MBO8219542.1 acetyltransferase [Prochlorococcus marinus CUG1416]
MILKKHIIYGARGHGRSLLYSLKNDGLEILCFIDQDKDLLGNCISGIPIYKSLDDFQNINDKNDEISILIGVGGTNSTDRKYLFEQVIRKNYSIDTYISKSAIVMNTCSLSKGVQILLNTTIAGNVKIREGVIVNSGSIIEHDSSVGAFTHIAPGVTICGSVHIGNMSFIGAGSTILPGIKIGSNSIVGAGSLVTKDIESNMISYGSPAKVIKARE